MFWYVSLCLSTWMGGGEGVVGGGIPPSFQMGGTLSFPMEGWMGTPSQDGGGGRYRIQLWMVGGVPYPALDREGTPSGSIGVPTSWTGWVPPSPSWTGWGTPPPIRLDRGTFLVRLNGGTFGIQSSTAKYLLRSGRYTSCVHAGGFILVFFFVFFFFVTATKNTWLCIIPFITASFLGSHLAAFS